MKVIKKIGLVMVICLLLCGMDVIVSAATVDYTVKTNDELDIIIEDNNKNIEVRSKKLAEKNKNCIDSIKNYTSNYTQEFADKISAYTSELKIITDRIRKQKITCTNREKRLQKAKLSNKSQDVIKNLQIKYINSQNKLLLSIKNASTKSKAMMKFIKKDKNQITTSNPKLYGARESNTELDNLEVAMENISL